MFHHHRKLFKPSSKNNGHRHDGRRPYNFPYPSRKCLSLCYFYMSKNLQFKNVYKYFNNQCNPLHRKFLNGEYKRHPQTHPNRFFLFPSRRDSRHNPKNRKVIYYLKNNFHCLCNQQSLPN